VSAPRPSGVPRRLAPPSSRAVLARAGFVVLVAASLLGGMSGGLLRVGWVLPGAAGAAWLPQAALFHAALMIGGFLGTVIGIERAVALRHRAAFLAPLASGLAGLCLLLGRVDAGAWLGVIAAVAFVCVNLVVVRRQPAAHTWLLLVSALAWLVGNTLFAAGIGRGAPLPWWFSFLVMTIAAERLEMTRLTRRRPEAPLLLAAVLTAMLGGAAWFATSPAFGVFAQGLSRYMALALLGGYVWLAIAGLAWAGMAFGLRGRDVALHALGLGFVVSMVMGHAPVILPAVARIKLRFGGFFYVPLVALHLSLALRLGPGSVEFAWRAEGALFNAAAILLFAATVAGAALAWRFQQGGPRAGDARPSTTP
jgi:hypothetical protein